MNNHVSINKNTIESVMEYKNVAVLHYKINYPQLGYEFNQKDMDRINNYYKVNALSQQNKYETLMYDEAVKQYEDSIANGFPFHFYEAVIDYEVTYNQNCTLSLYTDRYEFTGGAHGNTVRTSETWNLLTGKQVELWQNFNYYLNDRAYVIDMIEKQIDEQIKNGENMYFENYEELVIKNFNPDNFYLNNDGIVIYYQQYDIAPYASGIPEFLIPYSEYEVNEPSCRY